MSNYQRVLGGLEDTTTLLSYGGVKNWIQLRYSYSVGFIGYIVMICHDQIIHGIPNFRTRQRVKRMAYSPVEDAAGKWHPNPWSWDVGHFLTFHSSTCFRVSSRQVGLQPAGALGPLARHRGVWSAASVANPCPSTLRFLLNARSATFQSLTTLWGFRK